MNPKILFKNPKTSKFNFKCFGVLLGQGVNFKLHQHERTVDGNICLVC